MADKYNLEERYKRAKGQQADAYNIAERTQNVKAYSQKLNDYRTEYADEQDKRNLPSETRLYRAALQLQTRAAFDTAKDSVAATLPQRRDYSAEIDALAEQMKRPGADIAALMEQQQIAREQQQLTQEQRYTDRSANGLGYRLGALALGVMNTAERAADTGRKNEQENLRTYTEKRDAAQTEEERARWQKLVDVAQARVDAGRELDEVEHAPARDAQKELQRRASEASYTARAMRAVDTADKYATAEYDDTFSGRWGANYGSGRLSQNLAYAAADYMDNPTAENRAILDLYRAGNENLQANNADALARDNKFEDWTADIAGYMPQRLDQLGARVKGGVLGTMVGATNAGQALASAADMYRITRGGAFLGLLDAGVPEEQAMAMANDEALISSIIEYADSILEYGTLGGKEIVNLLLHGGAEKLGTTAAKSKAKEIAKKLAAYGLNILQEGEEERSQEAVSIANQRRYDAGTADSGKLALARAAMNVYVNEGLQDNGDHEAHEQMAQAARGGQRIATVFGAGQAATGYAAGRANARLSTASGIEAFERAEQEFDANGTVSAAAARAIAQNRPAREYLQSIGAVTLTDDMTGKERTEAVRDAVSSMLGAGETETAAEGNFTPAETERTEAQETPQETPQTVQTNENVDEILRMPERGVDDATLEHDVAEAQKSAATLGRQGARSFETAYTAEVARRIAPEEAFGEYAKVYNAALKGEAIPETTLPAMLRTAAENAGRIDARTAAQAKFFGREDAGLAKNRSGRPRGLKSRDARVLDAIGKAAGVRIRFADRLIDEGGYAANAWIDPETGDLLIAKDAEDPVKAAVSHETVHRVREASPEAYTAMARFIMENMSDERYGLELGKRRITYGDMTDYTNSDFSEELVADAFGRMLNDAELLEKATGTERTTMQKVLDALTELIDRIRKILGAKEAQLTPEQTEGFRDLQGKAEEMAKLLGDALKETEQHAVNEKNTATEGGVRYSKRSEVLALEGVDWMDDHSSIKQQLQKHAGEINAMEPVAVVEYTSKSAPRLVGLIMDEVAKVGGPHMKRGNVTFEFDEFGAKHIRAHANSNETYAAALTAPCVAKYGKLIAGHKNHEGGGTTTLTYAAPVVLNGKTANVGVVVQFTNDGRPHAVNVGVQSGSGTFKMDMTKAPEGTNSRVTRYEQGTALSTTGASTDKVAETPASVKRESRKSDAEYLAAVERGDTDAAQRMVDEAAREAGYTVKAYHGTPNGTFNVFREWSYFTESKKYADVYQNQGASSNGYKQTASNPKTYSVYLNPKDVFDTRTERDRRIFQNEFYRQWGNGAPLSERGLPDWTDGDDLIEFFDDKGYDYDAFYLDEGGTGGYGDKVEDRGVSIIVKDSAQVKSADPVTYDDNGNVIPLSERFNSGKKDIRFSLKQPVEQSKTLIALHNLDANKLRSMMKLGAIPSPSIAIVRAEQGHTNYGEYSMIFPRSTIDPQADRRNKVYGSDAWTPTHSNARIESKVDRTVQQRVDDRLAELGGKIADGMFRRTSLLKSLGIGDDTDMTTDEIAERLAQMDEVRAAYLADRGETLEPVKRAKQWNRKYGNEYLQLLLQEIKPQRLAQIVSDIAAGANIGEALGKDIETVRGVIREYYANIGEALLQRQAQRRGWTAEETDRQRERRIDESMERNVSLFTLEQFVKDAWDFYEDNGRTKGENDRIATSDALRARVNDADVKAWALEQIDGLLTEEGIYNGADPYTAGGRRKGFSALHWPVTAENIVRAMNTADDRGAGYFGVGAAGMHAVATTDFRNVEQMHAEEGRLQTEDDEAHRARFKKLDEEIDGIVHDIVRSTEHHSDNTFEETEIIGGVMMEAAQGKRTAEAVQRAFARDGYTIKPEIARRIVEMYNHAAEIPTGYFEAKPKRVVSFDEAAALVMPDNAPDDIARWAQEHFNVLRYRHGDDADRLRKVNSVNGVRFSRKVYVGGTFPPYNESQSDANERATRWAHSEDVRAGDQKLASYRGSWYLIEKFDSSELGYQIVQKLTHKQAKEYFEEESYGLSAIRGLQGKSRKTGSGASTGRAYLAREHNLDLARDRQRAEAGAVQEVGLRQNDRRNAEREGDGDRAGGGEDRQGADAGVRRSRMTQGTEEERRTAALERQNDVLREQVEYWKGQLKRSDPAGRADPAAVRKTARELIRDYGTDFKTNDLAEELQVLYDYIGTGRDEDGGELSYDAAKEIARQIAADIVDNAIDEETSMYAQYSDLRKYLQTQKFTITKGESSEIGDYGYWRRENRGRINISIGEHTNLDVLYGEMSDHWPELFPADIISTGEQLALIANVTERLYSDRGESMYAAYRDQAIMDTANDILDRFFDVPQYKTYADRQAKKIEQLRIRLSDLRRENEERLRAADIAAREERDERVQAVKDHYAEIAARRRERRSDSEERTRLLKIIRRLQNRKLDAVTRAKLNEYIADIDTVSKGITGKSVQKLTDLREWYTEQKENDPDFISDPHIEKALERLSKRHISDMTQEEVAQLTEVLLNIEHEINTRRKLIDDADRRDTALMGVDVIRDINRSRGIGENTAGALDRLFVNNTLSPVREMHRLIGYEDSDPLYRLTLQLADGQRKQFDYQRRASERFNRWTENRKLTDRIRGKKAQEIKVTGLSADGVKTVSITPAMRMSLYLHSKNDQNLRHIAQGGVVVPDMQLYKQGKIEAAYDRGTTIKLTPSEVRSIVSQMTTEEKAFADAAHAYFNGMSREEINATSEKLKGYSIAGVENYFPIDTDKNFVKKDFDALKFDGTLEGMGFLKERVNNAAAPIMLRDMDSVLRRSIDQHAKYVGLAIPVRNFNKVWGVTKASFNADGTRNAYDSSVMQAMKQKWGSAATRYIEKLMSDLQSGYTEQNDFDRLMRSVRSNYAGAVLTLNASVAMKQAASYPTAAAVVGWKPLLRALRDVGKVDLDLINRYTPLLWYRSQGFSTQELGDLAKQDRQLPTLLNWIQGVDVLTTRKLWKAAEYFVQDNNKELSRGSDAYYKAVADVYNGIIEETQPNYTTMQRPQILRSNSTLLQSLSMFKTQPFQNFNVLYDALGNLRAKKEALGRGDPKVRAAQLAEAKQRASWAVTSQVVQLAVFAGMTAAWNLFRGKTDNYDDDDGEVTAASVLKRIAHDMLGGAFSNVPFGSDVFEFLDAKIGGTTYYGFDEITSSSINDLLNAFSKAGSALGDTWETVSTGGKVDWNAQRLQTDSVLKAVSKVAGVPFENIENLFNAIYRKAAIAATGKFRGTYAYLKLTTAPTKTAPYYNNLYDAYRNDTAAYEAIYADMIGNGFDESKIRAAMEKRMKDAAGVSSAGELENRFLAPAAQAQYDRTLGEVAATRIWALAGNRDGLQEKTRGRIYDLAAGTSDGKKLQEKIDGGRQYGLTDTEYILFRAALDTTDKPSESGKYGTYTNDEVETAIRAVQGLSDKERRYLWIASGRNADKSPW